MHNLTFMLENRSYFTVLCSQKQPAEHECSFKHLLHLIKPKNRHESKVCQCWGETASFYLATVFETKIGRRVVLLQNNSSYFVQAQ